MKDYLEKKIQSMKQEMNAPPSKKRKVDYSLFNKNSCQKQFQFNFGKFELAEETI